MKPIARYSLSKTIRDMQQKLVSPVEMIDYLCDRIDGWDGIIKAFLPEDNRRERLHKDLDELYKKFPNPLDRPELFAIPIAVKDLFRVDGFATKAGSKLPSEIFEGKEAAVVTALKNRGALIMGKTVTTEFAYFHPGPTCNPHNFTHTPGGSSSGSAAAVAAGFVPLSFGTQTIGSISRPASFCGVIGFKPSFGRISTAGVIPFSSSADHVGFFTQDLEGSEIIASILCEGWNKENVIYSKKPILGVPDVNYLKQASTEVLQAFESVILELINKGFEVKRIATFSDIEKINSYHRAMNAAEFSQVHRNWVGKYQDKYHQASLDLIETGRRVSSEDLALAKNGRLELRDELEKLQKENNIDVWISPAAPTTAPKGLASTGNPIMNLPWTYAGVPTLAIPFGEIENLPFGIQFSGSFFQDEKLFGFMKYLMSEKL